MYPPADPNPPCSTTSHPRFFAGMDSVISAYTIGSIPPADMPMMVHMNRFQPNEGMKPQIDVAMNRIDARRMAARLPTRSASTPQINDPTVVPVNANSGSIAARDVRIPYSALVP